MFEDYKSAIVTLKCSTDGQQTEDGKPIISNTLNKINEFNKWKCPETRVSACATATIIVLHSSSRPLDNETVNNFSPKLFSCFHQGCGVGVGVSLKRHILLLASTTRFWLVYSSCQACYLKRVLSSRHFVAAHTVGAVVRGNCDEYLSMTVWHAVITPSAH